MAHWECEAYAFFDLANNGRLQPLVLVVSNTSLRSHTLKRVLQPICFFRAAFGFGLLLPDCPIPASSLEEWFNIPKEALLPPPSSPTAVAAALSQ
jgi:hypothetical protein